MRKVKLSDVCSPKQWKTIPTNDLLDEGYPVYGANGIIGYYNEYNHEDPVVAITCRGATCGSINITVPKAYVTGNAMCMDDVRSDIEMEYLYYCLKHYDFNKVISGSAQPQITRHGMNKIYITVYTHDEQISIVNKLKKVERVIELRKQELQSLDDLIKARFVEMFGTTREKSNEFEIIQFNDIAEYIGDIGSNGANKVVINHLDMKDEEDYAMMVRFTNFTKNDFKEDVKYISKEAYDFFKKSQIFGGELIICKIGSAGQNYIMPYLNRPVSLGLNQIMVRIKDTILMPYLYQYLHTDYGEFLISGCINGAVTKTITKTELKKIPIMLPPIELQQQFADFVKQVDKSKLAVQKSLEKTQQLFDSLMQEYFG